MTDKILIFDTTLRDGEQSPGASLNTKQKLEIAKQLARLRVDIIEAGFPVSSPGDFEAVKLIAQSVKGPAIAGLARAKKLDIDACWGAVKHARKPRIHTFLATSAIHMKYKLKMSEKEVLKAAVEAVKYARKLTPDVEFSPEDAGRSEFSFLCKVVEAVIAAGAKTINIPDTVGYTTPSEFGERIANLIKIVPNSSKAIFSVHCHNDLGMATANSLAAVLNGARQVECTINGIGERAGNASLEEIVMAIKTRSKFFKLSTGVKTDEIYKTSKLVSGLTGMPVQPNKAIVGANAFAHEAGIHQHGVMSRKLTYEIMTPKSIGLKDSKLVLGKHSGRHAFKKRLEEMGYGLKGKKFEKTFGRFKVLADKKKDIFDEDIEAIIEDEISQIPETFTMDYINVTTGNQTIPTATVTVTKHDKAKKTSEQEAACGDGPVDAAYKAIDRITRVSSKLMDYSIRAVSRGKDAVGEVSIKVAHKNRIYSGRGVSTDIIEASARAYLNAINKIIFKKR
ncbi:MAG: 2-isopropylmalate synthase [bacterium]